MGHTETGVSEIECPCCGDVGACANEGGFFEDGQALVCGCPGWVSCDTETEPDITLDEGMVCVACELRSRITSLEKDIARLKEEGEIRKRFYELTVKERDLERIRVNHLQLVGISAEEMKVHLDDALKRIGQLEVAARGVVASEHDDLDTGSVNWVAVLREAVEQLRKVLGDE